MSPHLSARELRAHFSRSTFKHLPTQVEVQSIWRQRGFQKGKTRAEENEQAAKDDVSALNRWRVQIFARDGGKCRCCGRKVKKTLENLPARAEAHHLAGRADKAVRYDVRNGLLTCNSCHSKITAGKIAITQPARLMFTAPNGKSYINGSEPVEFRR